MRLHPGLDTALRRFDFDETQLARAMAAGELPSPQRFANSWYFRIRLSGTGLSYRPQLNEYVERLPEHYLAPDKPDLPSFAARCNGLPVIWAHPPKMKLDTEEYAKRTVGTVVLPYVGDEDGEDEDSDEVWGVARILDEDAARQMREKKLSTSPAVELPPGNGGRKVPTGDGKHLLVENRPRMVDHVAIVPEGVWDKMGIAGRGVDDGNLRADGAGSTAGETGVEDMAEEKTKEEMEKEKMEADRRRDDRSRGDGHKDDGRHRDDADEQHQAHTEAPDEDLGGIKAMIADGFKKLHDRMDAQDKRMDAMDDDKRRADAESAAKEKEQQETLERLAKEEGEEAEDLEKKETGDKKDSLRRRDDESEEEHSERVHDAATRHDGKHLRRRDDESMRDHSRRADAAVAKVMGIKRGDARRDDDRHKDDARRDDGAKHPDGCMCDGCKDDRKRADARRDESHRDDDRRRDDGKRDDDRRADAARDAEMAELARRVARQDAELAALRREPTDEDRRVLADIQQRADSVLIMHSDQAPAPMRRETVGAYRVRMARKLQAHSKKWANTDLDRQFRISPDDFSTIEGEIYADAATAAKEPTIAEEGRLVPVPIPTSTGHKITEYRGDPMGWMNRFMHTGACCKTFGLGRGA